MQEFDIQGLPQNAGLGLCSAYNKAKIFIYNEFNADILAGVSLPVRLNSLPVKRFLRNF